MVKVVQIGVGVFDANFSYLLLGTGAHKKEGVLIDPAGSAAKIENEIKKHSVKVVLQLFTHLHSDHTELRGHFDALGVPSFAPKPKALGLVEEISAAGLKIAALHTPGHTKEGVCFLVDGNLFSGDTLFVRGVGTTAYGGDEIELKKTLGFLFTLDPKLTLWPGHDYGGASSKLGTALSNSHLRPSSEILKMIKKKVFDYESKKL